MKTLILSLCVLFVSCQKPETLPEYVIRRDGNYFYATFPRDNGLYNYLNIYLTDGKVTWMIGWRGFTHLHTETINTTYIDRFWQIKNIVYHH